MKRNKLIILLIFFIFHFTNSCAQEKYNGDYCANVKYTNLSTGKKSNYNLTIKIQNDNLVQLNFPNGGYLDNELKNADISSGKALVKYNDKLYEIFILSKGNDCLNDVPSAVQCIGKTKKGSRCKNKTDNKNGYCRFHN